VTYPTIALYKRISVLQPASGAVVRSPVTFTWDALTTTNVYELRVYEDDPQNLGVVASGRTSVPTFTLSTLAPGHRYKWDLTAYVMSSGREVIVGTATVRLFSTSAP